MICRPHNELLIVDERGQTIHVSSTAEPIQVRDVLDLIKTAIDKSAAPAVIRTDASILFARRDSFSLLTDFDIQHEIVPDTLHHLR
ncbi:hypothetical protein AC629_02000 [Bradyrhizobium sp. NAS80.1]|nr:hypothetical protein AC629_02000 [Bradyrhizobium sp. NAS80.1]